MTGPALRPAPDWYCVCTRPKTEHQVARRLRQLPGVDVFCPRIRFRKPTRRGPVWFSEALFPGYVFAAFLYHIRGNEVRYTVDVRGLVEFGSTPATVPAEIIQNLRAELGTEEEKVFDEPLHPGESARVLEGPFTGIEAVVTRVLPARQRVRILLTFLGRETEAEVPLQAVARTKKPRVLQHSNASP